VCVCHVQVEYKGGKDIAQTSQILSATNRPGQYTFVGQDSWGGIHLDDSRANRSEEASQASTDPQFCKIRIISSGSLQVKMRSWIDIAMASSLPNFVK